MLSDADFRLHLGELTGDELRLAKAAFALAQASATRVPEILNEKQVVSACYSFRHDFGLLDSETQASLSFSCREWWHAIRKELMQPSQHPFVLATAAGQPLPLSGVKSDD